MLIGASAKSAQLGLHGWLANAMEGGLDKINSFKTLNLPVYIHIAKSFFNSKRMFYNISNNNDLLAKHTF